MWSRTPRTRRKVGQRDRFLRVAITFLNMMKGYFLAASVDSSIIWRNGINDVGDGRIVSLSSLMHQKGLTCSGPRQAKRYAKPLSGGIAPFFSQSTMELLVNFYNLPVTMDQERLHDATLIPSLEELTSRARRIPQI